VRHCIIVGADVHTKSILVKAAVDRDEPVQRSFRNTRAGRRKLVAWLSGWSARVGGARVVVVYEASSLGYVLYDEVTAAWLDALVEGEELGWGARVALCTLLSQLRSLEGEQGYLDEQLEALAAHERYAAAAEAMDAGYKGVGLRVALTLLTELGDLDRFGNRRCLASYAGLVPTSDESGEADDRKGHITHQGPPRVRRALCQAAHQWVRWDPEAKARYKRLVARGGRRAKKIALVAMMRRLLIRLWHTARRALAAAHTAQDACE